MELSRKGFICKVESFVSTICGVVWWAATYPSPMQNPEKVSSRQHQQLGLKALMTISDPKETVPHRLIASSGIIHSYNISSASASASLSKSSSWSSSTFSFKSWLPSLPCFVPQPSSGMDDLIGTESGVYMSSFEDLVPAEVEESQSCSNGRPNKGIIQEPATKRKYPPPIPILAGTGNLVAHMPWVLTRRYTNDGKLILTEEKGEYQEYLEAKREDGRLVLSLVSLDNPNIGHDDKEEQMEEGEEEDVYLMEGVHDTETELVDLNICDDDSCDDENWKQRGPMEMLASSMPEMPMMHEMISRSCGRRCLTVADRAPSSDASNMFHPMLNIVYT